MNSRSLFADHFEGQLVVVAQKDRPLTVVRDLRRLAHDLGDRVAVLLGGGHVEPRHQREVERHIAFVAVAKVLARVLGPLVGLGEEQPTGEARVHRRAQLLDHLMGLGEVLVGRPLAHAEVGDRVEAQPVDPERQPEVHQPDHGLHDLGVVVVEVWLVGKEAVPIVGLRGGVPGPVRALRVGKDDPRLGVLLVRVAPDVEVALGRARGGAARSLKPRMLIGGVVDHELGDHAEVAAMRLADEALEVAERAVVGVHVGVVGDVVAIIPQRRRIEGQQPDRRHAEVANIVELVDQTVEVADAIVVTVGEATHVGLIDDRILVPKRSDMLTPRARTAGR